MATIKKAAVLAAGEGTRIREISKYKPMVEINGQPLIDRLLLQMSGIGAKEYFVAFNSTEKGIDFKSLDAFNRFKVNFFFVDTPSSMHTLYEVLSRVNLQKGEHILISMVDTILRDRDFKIFADHCLGLKANESTLLVTSFIDDEKPLVVKVDAKGCAEKFGGDKYAGALVTSGIYCFSADAYPLLLKALEEGVHKMRNFLAFLLEHNHTVRTFTVEKTVDIDHPQDIKVAEEFLKS